MTEHARFCVEVFYALYIKFHSFIHSFILLDIYTHTLNTVLLDIHTL